MAKGVKASFFALTEAAIAVGPVVTAHLTNYGLQACIAPFCGFSFVSTWKCTYEPNPAMQFQRGEILVRHTYSQVETRRIFTSKGMTRTAPALKVHILDELLSPRRWQYLLQVIDCRELYAVISDKIKGTTTFMPINRRTIQPVLAILAVMFLGACASAGPDTETTGPAPVETQTTPPESPTNEQHATAPTAAAPQISTYMTSDGMFEFDYPSDWSVVSDPASSSNDVPLSLIVQDAQGRRMAKFAEGFPAVNDSVVAGPIAPVPLEYHKIPDEQIAPTREGSAIAYHYEVKFNPVSGEIGAEMSINTFKTDSPITSSLPGFHIDSATGAAFTRWIGPSDELPDIGPDLKDAGGSVFFEAYQRTAEYQAVKEMMTSLRRLT